jgi:hypothetical protein
VSRAALDAPSDKPAGGGNGGAGFYLATLTFRRQRQLKNGARPRVESGNTLVRVALLEVMAGLVACEGEGLEA